MTNIKQDTSKWKASITVKLEPINSYGDVLGESSLTYSIFLNGSLIEVVTKLESLQK